MEDVELRRVTSMLRPEMAVKFYRVLTELEPDLLEDVHHAVSARLGGDDCLVLLTYREFHLLHETDESHDLHLWRGTEVFSTDVQIGDGSTRGAVLHLSGLLELSLELNHSDAVELHRELRGDSTAGVGGSSSRTRRSAEGTANESLQNWSLGIGVAAPFLAGFGIVPLVGIGVGLVAISRSVRSNVGLVKAASGTALSVLGLLVHLVLRGDLVSGG